VKRLELVAKVRKIVRMIHRPHKDRIPETVKRSIMMAKFFDQPR
jgi:hypothetical protein